MLLSGLLVTYAVAGGAMVFCALTILTFVHVLTRMDRTDQEHLAENAEPAGIFHATAEKSAREHAIA